MHRSVGSRLRRSLSRTDKPLRPVAIEHAASIDKLEIVKNEVDMLRYMVQKATDGPYEGWSIEIESRTRQMIRKEKGTEPIRGVGDFLVMKKILLDADFVEPRIRDRGLGKRLQSLLKSRLTQQQKLEVNIKRTAEGAGKYKTRLELVTVGRLLNRANIFDSEIDFLNVELKDIEGLDNDDEVAMGLCHERLEKTNDSYRTLARYVERGANDSDEEAERDACKGEVVRYFGDLGDGPGLIKIAKRPATLTH